MMKWLRAIILRWLFSGVTAIRVGDKTTTIDTNGVTFGDATVIATANSSHAEPTRAIGTTYQNTSGKTRIVLVQVTTVGHERADVYCDASATPTTLIAKIGSNITDTLVGDYVHGAVTFVVPDDYYYKVVNGTGTPVLDDWHEWDLH